MNAVPVLDYLDELLGDAPPAAVSASRATPVPAAPAAGAAIDGGAATPIRIAATAPAAPAPIALPPRVPEPVSVPPPPAAPAPSAGASRAAMAVHPLLVPAPPAPAAPVEPSVRWLRLRCGPQAYALELLKVQEVVLPTVPLPLRGTSASMLGVMNLRGQVVPVLDLGRHLGGAPVAVDAAARIVVLEENGDTLGLLVSAVEDVTSLQERQIESPDNARPGRFSNDLFRGIARQGQQPLILLDASILLRAS